MSTTSPITAAHQVRVRREAKEISARRLSMEAGLSPAYVHKLERGDIEPGLRQFARIARVLKFNPQEVFLIVMGEAQR